MTVATLCDQCDQRVAFDDQWRIRIEVRASTSWFKRAFVLGSTYPDRQDLHFCSAACLAIWATHLAGRDDAPTP